MMFVPFVLGQLPPKKIDPNLNSNANPKQNLNPNRGKLSKYSKRMAISTGYNKMYEVHGVSRIIQKHPSKATLNFFS